MAGLHRRLGLGGTALAAVLALAACSQQEAAAPTPPPAVAPPPATQPQAPLPAPAAPAEGETVGGDGSAIALSALSAADLETNALPGELGCSFSTAASPLLIAKGNVASREPAQGLVKVTGYVERIAAPGGFDAMLKGATFSGAGKTIRIALIGPATGGGESPPSPATLTYQRADGASLTLAGRWECGP